MAKRWQAVEIVAVPAEGESSVNLFTFHQNFAKALKELDIGPGECVIPLPTRIDLPGKDTNSWREGSFRFYALLYAEKIPFGTWHIG